MSDVASCEGDTSGLDRGTVMSRTELGLVVLMNVAVHLIMLVLGMPLPHVDLSTYVEPAFLLAQTGVLAGPATQHQDLLYTVGFYSYPPGYFLLLGGWVKVFGPSTTFLLAYTHFVHTILMVTVWTLLRQRFRATRVATALAIASLFPLFHH